MTRSEDEKADVENKNERADGGRQNSKVKREGRRFARERKEARHTE